MRVGGEPGGRLSSWRGWVVRGVSAAAVLAVLRFAGAGLRGEALGDPEIAPNGIVSLELAGTPAKAQQILDVWAAGGRVEEARASLAWDFGFIIVYAVTLVLWVWWARSRFPGRWWRRLGSVAITLVVVAGAADFAENMTLYRVFDVPTVATTAWARRFAILKFVLIGVAIAYVLATPIRMGIRRLRHT